LYELYEAVSGVGRRPETAENGVVGPLYGVVSASLVRGREAGNGSYIASYIAGAMCSVPGVEWRCTSWT